MKIEKRQYSRSPWRLLDSSGNEVYWQEPMKHSTLGQTYVNAPICGETKAECLEKTLTFLEKCVDALKKYKLDKTQ